MEIIIQSLSWSLIYSLGQGFLVFGALWIMLKMLPGCSSAVKYNLSLSAFVILLAWFGLTWWQQFQQLTVLNSHELISSGTVVLQQWDLDNIHNRSLNVGSFLIAFNRLLPWLTVFYFIGLSLMLLRLCSGFLQLVSLRQKLTASPDINLVNLFYSLKEKLNLDSKVELLISLKARVPMVIGVIKPLVLLPAASVAQLSPAQLETILLHELAHIKRNDYLINILQTIVETILFFNPFVWLISAIIRREREHCCDDLVLVHTREPLNYATALAALAAYPGNASGLLVAASGQSYPLFHRIKRILEMKKNPFSYSRMVAAILIITVISCSVVWLTPSFANKKDKPNLTEIPASNKLVPEENQEEKKLVRMLSEDHLIDESKGFTLERKGDKLYIDYKLQTVGISSKYLPAISKKELRVEVYPFKERVKQHPGASLLQLSAPVILSSPCVDYKPQKEGC